MSKAPYRHDDDEARAFELQTKFGTARARGYRSLDLVIMLCAVTLCLSPPVFFWFHSREVGGLAEAVKENAIAQKFVACINATPQEQRFQQLEQGSYCDRMARAGLIPP